MQETEVVKTSHSEILNLCLSVSVCVYRKAHSEILTKGHSSPARHEGGHPFEGLSDEPIQEWETHCFDLLCTGETHTVFKMKQTGPPTEPGTPVITVALSLGTILPTGLFLLDAG